MTHTQTFIELAIEGGWWPRELDRPEEGQPTSESAEYLLLRYEQPYASLLDPLAWAAVGKSRGWDEKLMCPVCGNGIGRDCDEKFIDEWAYNFHSFVNLLTVGKSIEEALGEILA